MPKARYLGVTPQDIIDFKLQDCPRTPLAGRRRQARQAMPSRTIPFFQSAQAVAEGASQQMLKMGVRAEQQALAKWGLNYVIEEYLPRKLEQTGRFLP